MLIKQQALQTICSLSTWICYLQHCERQKTLKTVPVVMNLAINVALSEWMSSVANFYTADAFNRDAGYDNSYDLKTSDNERNVTTRASAACQPTKVEIISLLPNT